jgi:2-methylisocitrate lyase-like PEP mutase family enzyme
MNIKEQVYLAEKFQQLHLNGNMFVLPNAWDVGSAVVYEKCMFPAVGTSSAGLAYSLGYSDGQKIDFEYIIQMTKMITERVSIPVTVDIELGYADTIEGIVENVTKVIKAGAVGINIEDGHLTPSPYLEDLGLQMNKIKAIKELKEELGIPFLINARTCVYFNKIGKEDERLSIAIERGKAFVEAGADCFFVPGPVSESDIKNLVDNIPGPINVLITPVTGNLDNLKKLGVTRVSLGSAPARAIYSYLTSIVNEVQSTKSTEALLSHSLSYDAANKFFSR